MNTLRDVIMDREVVITNIKDRDGMKRRLLDLGFVEGSRVIPVLNSPSKGMRAYLVKGCKIALRNHDAENILIEEVMKFV